MPPTPRNRTPLPWKIHDETGALRASTATAEDAVTLLNSLPPKSHVKADERPVFVKDATPLPDDAADTMRTRRTAAARALETMREARTVAASIAPKVAAPVA